MLSPRVGDVFLLFPKAGQWNSHRYWLVGNNIFSPTVVTVGFAPFTYSFDEADGVATLMIEKVGQIDRDITLSFSTQDGSAISTGEYNLLQ